MQITKIVIAKNKITINYVDLVGEANEISTSLKINTYAEKILTIQNLLLANEDEFIDEDIIAKFL